MIPVNSTVNYLSSDQAMSFGSDRRSSMSLRGRFSARASVNTVVIELAMLWHAFVSCCRMAPFGDAAVWGGRVVWWVGQCKVWLLGCEERSGWWSRRC